MSTNKPSALVPFHVLDDIAADCGVNLPAARALAKAEEAAEAVANATDAELLRLHRHGTPEIREAARLRLIGRGIDPVTGEDPFEGLS